LVGAAPLPPRLAGAHSTRQRFIHSTHRRFTLAGAAGSMSVDFFLSHYQVEAQSVALLLKTCLDPLGKKCWLDITETDHSVRAMEEGIKNCDCVIAIITPGYFDRPFCVKELGWALQYRKPIQPVYPSKFQEQIGPMISQAPNFLQFLAKINWLPVDTSDIRLTSAACSIIIEDSGKRRVEALQAGSDLSDAFDAYAGSQLAQQMDGVTLQEPVAYQNKIYHLIHAGSNKFVDSHGDKVWLWGDGVNVGGGPQNISWMFVPTGEDDTYYIVHLGTNKFLDSHGQEGKQVWLWGDGVSRGGAAQNISWRIQPVDGKAATFYIIHVGSGKFMDSHGKEVWLWGDGVNVGGTPQKLQFRFVESACVPGSRV